MHLRNLEGKAGMLKLFNYSVQPIAQIVSGLKDPDVIMTVSL